MGNAPTSTLKRLLKASIVLVAAIAMGCGGGGGGGSSTGSGTGSTSGNVVRTDTKNKWTVLVFLNSANDLQDEALPNIIQMQKIANQQDVRFVVQWKETIQRYSGATSAPLFVSTRRYLIQPSSSNTQLASQLIQDMGTGVDMGSAQTLHDFIDWGKKFSPSERYALIVWDHGSGWRSRSLQKPKTRSISYDAENGTIMQVWDFSTALQGFHLDVIGFDACLMQMAEVAYELKPYADFLVGSEENTPGPGYPYDAVFSAFVANPSDSTSNLCKSFGTAMVNDPRYKASLGYPIEQSTIDTSKLDAVAAAVKTFGTVLASHKAELSTVWPNVRNNSQAFADLANGMYYDPVDFCTRLEAATNLPDVIVASQNVRAAIGSAVVWEAHNSLRPGSHGLALDFSDSSTFTGAIQGGGSLQLDYSLLKWQTASNWGAWLAQSP